MSFNRWLRKQPFKQRVVCAGNHDRYFQNMPEIALEVTEGSKSI
jgi:hypothetical protein